jgi:hypothetical protein
MKLWKPVFLILLWSPALAAAAATTATSPLVVPGLMTPTGRKFADKCSDAAFADAADPAARTRRCERLLLQWRLEAARRTDALADKDDSEPGFLSLRGIPRYPPSF